MISIFRFSNTIKISMYIPTPEKFDFSSYKKAWHSDVIESEIDGEEDYPLLQETLVLQNSALAVKDVKRMYYSCILGDVEKVCGWNKEVFLHGGVSF